MNLDAEIRNYYERAPEAERPRTGAFQPEFERAKELLGTRLPEPPATILDVGGGPGPYALWLAALGHEVHLIDPVPKAKFHRPEELKEEVAAVGFASVEVFGIEGPAWILPDFDERWQDQRRRLDVLAIARRFESEPSVQGMSAHLLAVGEKPPQ